jgi:hypothetical protein
MFGMVIDPNHIWSTPSLYWAFSRRARDDYVEPRDDQIQEWAALFPELTSCFRLDSDKLWCRPYYWRFEWGIPDVLANYIQQWVHAYEFCIGAHFGGSPCWGHFLLLQQDMTIGDGPPPGGCMKDAFAALRKAGGSAWDDIDDPESYLDDDDAA